MEGNEAEGSRPGLPARLRKTSGSRQRATEKLPMSRCPGQAARSRGHGTGPAGDLTTEPLLGSMNGAESRCSAVSLPRAQHQHPLPSTPCISARRSPGLVSAPTPRTSSRQQPPHHNLSPNCCRQAAPARHWLEPELLGHGLKQKDNEVSPGRERHILCVWAGCRTGPGAGQPARRSPVGRQQRLSAPRSFQTKQRWRSEAALFSEATSYRHQRRTRLFL